MELTNYWWLLIWLFTGGLFFEFCFAKKEEMVCGKIEYRWGWLPAMGLAMPYLIWAAGRKNFGDTPVYMETFHDLPVGIGQIPKYLIEHTKDKGFSIFQIVIKTMFGDSTFIFFLIVATVQIVCIVKIYRKFSPDYWMSMFLFIVSTDYLSWMHNGMRQFLAVTLIFAAFSFVIDKKYVPAICIILLASTIHGSALIMLPIIFIIQGEALNKKTVLVVLAMLVVVLMIDQFTPILNDLLADTQYSTTMTDEIWVSDDGTSIIRVLVYSVPALMAIVGRKYVKVYSNPVINISVNCSLITMGIYLISSVSSGIYIGRLPIYTSLMGYIALPWLIDHMFTEDSAKSVKVCMYLAYLVFFYFQMHFTWGVL